MQVISNPLAGSRPRSEDPVEDKRRAEELLSSPKDLHEHAVVVEAVAADFVRIVIHYMFQKSHQLFIVKRCGICLQK